MVEITLVSIEAKANWGDVPTWISAGTALLGMVVSTIALLFAAKAARTAHAVYRIESERDRRSEQERIERHNEAMAEQASKVACWFEKEGRLVTIGPHRDVPRVRFLIRNASDVPIYDVHAYYFFPSQDGIYEAVKQFPLSILGPAATTDFSADARLLVRVGPEIADKGRMAMAFRDAGGIYWWRNINGRLKRTESLHSPPRSALSTKKVYIHTADGPREWDPLPGQDEWT